MEPNLLFLTGLGDSGENHWQSLWLKKFKNSSKLIQKNWNEPRLEDWLQNITTTIESINKPTVLIAHSLAVSLVAHWSLSNSNPFILGAFLVAPADVDSTVHAPETIWNFAPIPLQKLPFQSIVITSSNDPYISSERAAFLAENWGGEFVDIGPKGHINSESDLGFWDEGQELLDKLLKRAITF